jgi:hypothetical protein
MGAHLQQHLQLASTSRAGGADTPPAAAAAAAGGGGAATSAFLARSRTMPAHGSFSSAVQSPSFAAGFGPGSFLHQAASWLPPAVQGSGQSRHTVDQLLRVMMAFTLMQGAGAGDTGGCGWVVVVSRLACQHKHTCVLGSVNAVIPW